MKKTRLAYWIFSLLASVGLLTLSIYSDYVFFYSLLIFLLLIINFRLKRRDMYELNSIILKYANHCDPELFINELKEYSSHCVLTKSQKLTIALYESLALTDLGNFEKAQEKLLDIEEKQKYLNQITTILYLRIWCDYFYYNGLNEKMKYTLLKMKNLIVSVKNEQLKFNFMMNYNFFEAKYSILVNQNLDKARSIFQSRFANVPTTLSAISIKYNLGLLDIKERNYETGIDKLRNVAKVKKKLFICDNADKIVKQFDKLQKHED